MKTTMKNPSVVVTTAAAAAAAAARMDLSYRPNISSKTFANFIQQQQSYNALELNLSSSEIDNEGIVEILESIPNKESSSSTSTTITTTTTTTTTLFLSLICRMNRITPVGVTNLLHLFLPNINEKEENPSNSSKKQDNKKKKNKARSSKKKKKMTIEVQEEQEEEDPQNNNEEKETVIDSSKEESKDNNEETTTTTTTTTASTTPIKLELLDLAWNSLHPPEQQQQQQQHDNNKNNKNNNNSKTYKEMLSCFRQLVQDVNVCPNILRLDCCGLTPAICRSIGKGLRNRENNNNNNNNKPISLYLSGNHDIGNAGVAALAAAIKSSTTTTPSVSNDHDKNVVVFDVLNLSGCNVGDAGVEALALALESRPGAIRHLDLSNNKITNRGAIALADALLGGSVESSTTSGGDGQIMYKLDLSNNEGIGDVGATSIAEAMKKGKLNNIILRSCSIYADGSQAFGSLINSLTTSTSSHHHDDALVEIEIDLSGNPIGTLRKKKKKNAASAIKSKASATTASYMSFISKKIQSGLKDVGLADSLGGFMSSSTTAESDDEEEENMNGNNKEDPADIDPAKARCGAKALASAIVLDDHQHNHHHDDGAHDKDCKIRCTLGMRRCFLDEGAADALAAAVLQARHRLGIKLSIDAKLNPALEERFVDALHGGRNNNDDESVVTALLEDMSERHMNELEILRLSEERAAQHAAAMRRQSRWDDDDDHHQREEELDDFFGGGEEDFRDDYYNDEEEDEQ